MPTPTDSMKAEARRGLDWRKEFGRGGTEIGVARARDIVNGRDLPRATIARMVSYFARHEVDKQGKGWSSGDEGYPSAGRIAWALWGGDPGKTWAEKELRKMDNSAIYQGIKEALVEGQSTVNLREASAITGSGSDVGGRVIYDDAFASLRYANPFRMCSRQITTIGSDQAFVVKTGNSSDTTNPWGYAVNTNEGSPNQATAFWQLPIRDVNAVLPIRTAILADIDNLEETVVMDLALEFSQNEANSMMFNNDQSGSTTTSFGATSGLRGLNSYPGSTSAAAFGSNGSAITNGIHTVLQVAQASASAVVYDDLANLMAALPSQYLYKPETCWMMHPTTIGAIRKLKGSTGGSPMFVEAGDDDGGAVIYIFGHRVIPNPYMDVAGVGKFPVYLANFERFVTIADSDQMSIKRFDQTAPGFVYLFAEKRVCSTILDVFAGVRLVGV
jgi:HK97 family phage major capsid protein